MENTDNNQENSRRKFLETGLTGVAGVALGLTVAKLILPEENDTPEMVKMLTPDGKLVAVDKRHLPPMCGTPVPISNKELQEWMKEGKL